MDRRLLVFFLVVLLNSLKSAAQLNLKQIPDSVHSHRFLWILPQNFYSQHTGFFCKKEVQVQRATALPLYIRLGSKEYVDYMEKKPNAMGRD